MVFVISFKSTVFSHFFCFKKFFVHFGYFFPMAVIDNRFQNVNVERSPKKSETTITFFFSGRHFLEKIFKRKLRGKLTFLLNLTFYLIRFIFIHLNCQILLHLRSSFHFSFNIFKLGASSQFLSNSLTLKAWSGLLLIILKLRAFSEFLLIILKLRAFSELRLIMLK